MKYCTFMNFMYINIKYTPFEFILISVASMSSWHGRVTTWHTDTWWILKKQWSSKKNFLPLLHGICFLEYFKYLGNHLYDQQVLAILDTRPFSEKCLAGCYTQACSEFPQHIWRLFGSNWFSSHHGWLCFGTKQTNGRNPQASEEVFVQVKEEQQDYCLCSRCTQCPEDRQFQVCSCWDCWDLWEIWRLKLDIPCHRVKMASRSDRLKCYIFLFLLCIWTLHEDIISCHFKLMILK